MEDILEVRNLSTGFKVEGKLIQVVDDVSFSVKKGEILGLVGESGSGKSVTSKTIMRLIPSPPGKILGGEILFEGKDILKMSKNELCSIRGNKISMIFQEPMSSLNPVYTCGNQIVEAIMLHQNVKRKEANERAIEMLKLVGMPLPEMRMNCYPHELSGGMRQRVMIAMALACEPQLLIADEPTTALDTTIQAQIMELIRTLRDKLDISVIYITHDLGVVAELCDRVMVMYAGRILEVASVKELFRNPYNPYTQGLIKAIPKIDEETDLLYNIPGNVPSFSDMPTGCGFCTRCPYADEKCKTECPPMIACGEDHYSRCWRCNSSEGA